MKLTLFLCLDNKLVLDSLNRWVYNWVHNKGVRKLNRYLAEVLVLYSATTSHAHLYILECETPEKAYWLAKEITEHFFVRKISIYLLSTPVIEE